MLWSRAGRSVFAPHSRLGHGIAEQVTTDLTKTALTMAFNCVGSEGAAAPFYSNRSNL